MYNLKKRSYITTVGELRSLLAGIPNSTEISACGACEAWLHFDDEKGLICIDYDSLDDCYPDFDEAADMVEEQQADHRLRLRIAVFPL